MVLATSTVDGSGFSRCSHLNPIDPAQYPADGRLGLEEPSTAATSWRRSVHPLTGALDDYDLLLERIGERRLVLIGEASHGTHEFYRERAVLTKRLIVEKGFDAVAVEADWPDAYRVNRYVRGASADADARRGAPRLRALSDLDVAQRRRPRLRGLAPGPQRRRGAEAAQGRLLRPRSLQSARVHGGGRLPTSRKSTPRRPGGRAAVTPASTTRSDPQAYGYAAELGLRRSCEDEAVGQLIELRRFAAEYLSHDGAKAADDFFFAEQNARLVQNAEEYYRGMFRGSRALLESPGPAHGRKRWRPSVAHLSSDRASRPGSSCGRTTPTSATRARRRWAPGASGTSGQLVAGTPRVAGLSPRIFHVRRDGHGRQRMARTGAAKGRPPRARGKLRGQVPSTPSCPGSSSPSARGLRVLSARSAARAGDRRRLPAGVGTDEPLLPCVAAGAVRRPHPHRPHAGGRAAREGIDLDAGRGARDLPDRRLTDRCRLPASCDFSTRCSRR